MANVLRKEEPEFSLSATIGQLLTDLQNLLRQEAALLRAEIKQDVKKSAVEAKKVVAGLAAFALAGIWLAIALVYVLHEAAGLPLWASFGIIGLTLVATGITLLSTREKREVTHGQRA